MCVHYLKSQVIAMKKTRRRKYLGPQPGGDCLITMANVGVMMQVVRGTVRQLHLRNTPGMPRPIKFGPRTWRFWRSQIEAWLQGG
jgi:predicted DNA-binding transcriptional regulator AlpA